MSVENLMSDIAPQSPTIKMPVAASTIGGEGHFFVLATIGALAGKTNSPRHEPRRQ